MGRAARGSTQIADSAQTDVHPLDPIFHPRAVAVVGVSSREDKPGGSGGMGGFLNSLIEGGYPLDRLYPVNPKLETIRDLKCYASLLDCPDPVDHVISQIPAGGVPELVDQAIEKGVRSIHFFTAGFAETGDEQMAAVEREFIAKGQAAGIRMIGPNCMGLYVPDEGLAFMGGFPKQSGEVFLLSQSGANAGDIVGGLSALGVRFSKAVSYGNGADLRAHHFLDYAAADPQTKVVTAYIEGVRDGRLFFDALKRCAAVKPTILLKGGITAAGARAASSHTGSLAGSADVFEALARQSGAIRARTLDELINLVISTTSRVRTVRGTGVALIAGGGGFSVLSSDQIALEGLDLPQMPPSVVEQMREFIPVAGTSVNNPIDANLSRHGDAETTLKLYTLVANAPGIDVVFTTVGGWGGWGANSNGDGDDGDDRDQRDERARKSADELADLQDATGTPFAAILRARGGSSDGMRAFFKRAHERELAVFPTLEAAAASVARMQEWQARREGLPEIFAG